MKILLMTFELFHEDRQTDMTKLIVAFRNFANELTNALNYNLCKYTLVCCHTRT